MQRKILIIFIFSLLGTSLFSMAMAESRQSFILNHGNQKILSFEIFGLENTQPSIVKREIELRPGVPLSMLNEERLIQRLKAKKIFESIIVSYRSESGGVVVEIHIKEKASFVPIPFVSSNSSGTSGGIFLFESNFLGLNKKVFFGGIYSEQGWTGHMGYIDPEAFHSNFYLSASLGFKDDLFENTDFQENTYAEYNARNIYAVLNFGYRFEKKLLLSWRGKYLHYKLKDSHQGLAPENQEAFVPGLRIQYKDLYYSSFSNSGPFATIDYAYAVPEGSHEGWHELTLKSKWAFDIFSNQLLAFHVNGEYSDKKTEAFQKRIGGRFGYKTLPSEVILSKKYISGAISWEVPIFKFSWGTFTGLAFYEIGTYQDYQKKWQNFNGPGSGFRLYLKKVAFPAVGFDAAYNTRSDEFYFSVAIGFAR